MDTRREFLKKAALLTAGAHLSGTIPDSIRRAFAIAPDQGTTWLDAEHVVILMQENRSFDHAYGMLRGVRGFNDPRAITLPNGNPVWLQTNAKGETYAPFRLDIKDTRATWMSSLPHTWPDQVDARNNGKHDGWLEAKRSGNRDYADLPLTLGFYDRDDIPFYYSLADAFTVCDQNFCSSLTGTTPNRLYLWSGTIRESPSILAKANLLNSDVDYDSEANWMTFPERLEALGVSWRVYQNEINLQTGLAGQGSAWLANFSDNPLEWFTQYHVRYAASYRKNLPLEEQTIVADLARLEAVPEPRSAAQQRQIATRRARLDEVRRDLSTYTEESWAKLSPREQQIHQNAFTTNSGDPDFHSLATLTYRDGTSEREMQVPKGDVLHQLRSDVGAGTLPTVSWIVAPENFSDHPSAPWYGTWYLSEVLDILTQNPETWKKTIFILCYDENDGYFDHVPPFVPPPYDRTDAGKASAGIDTSVEHVRLEQEQGRQRRAGPIGLGYRVPLVVASPWSRGGYVCSQVFDHTSILQCLETFVSHKTGRAVRESNISAWRRTVCGDLSSVFRPYGGEQIALPAPVERDTLLSTIHRAQYKGIPNASKALSASEIALTRDDPRAAAALPRQERGTRPSCALPYELSVDGSLNAERKAFTIQFAAGTQVFGSASAGAPFHVYAPGRVRSIGTNASQFESGRTWAYTVSAGDRIADAWSLGDFENGGYQLRVHGPNGFFREFAGTARDPLVDVTLATARGSVADDWVAQMRFVNRAANRITIGIDDLAYGASRRTVILDGAGARGAQSAIALDLESSRGWYDLRITVEGATGFERRYAGRIETGKESISDPAMG